MPQGIRYTIEYIKNKTKILEEEYECLSGSYKNNYTKLIFKCKKEHVYEVNWGKFQQGCRCPICRNESQKLTIEYIKYKTKKITDEYTCLSNKYINNHTKLEFKCDKDHIFYMRWNDFQQGQRCSICYKLSKYMEGNVLWRGGINGNNTSEHICF